MRRPRLKLQRKGVYFILGIAIFAILFVRSKYFASLLMFIVMHTLNSGLDKMKCLNGDNLRDHLYYRHTEDSIRLISRCILASPGKQTIVDYPPLYEERLNDPFLTLPEDRSYTDKVLILSPIRDAEHLLDRFAKILTTLTYPRHLISVGFAEDGSADNSFEKAKEVTQTLKNVYKFRDANAFKLSLDGNKVSHYSRHKDSIQIERRSHMAKARNMLTKLALRDEQWILWIDIDIIKFRPDVIEQFLYSNKDVMVASVFTERYIIYTKAMVYHLYERNSFNETVIDGKDYRLYTPDFKPFGREVPIQFVGSCMLMIRSDCIQRGLEFPESVITSEGSLVRGIESEGLGMLARKMGFRVYALPFLEAVHF